MKGVHTLSAVFVIAFLFWSAACVTKVGEIEVTRPWARATASTAKTGAAFMTIRNDGAYTDRLVAVSSGVSRKTELHESFMENDIMKMRHVDAIQVPAGGMVALEPSGFYVMFIGLKAPFKEGDSFPLTLVFEKAGKIGVSVTIMKAGAMGGMKVTRPWAAATSLATDLARSRAVVRPRGARTGDESHRPRERK